VKNEKIIPFDEMIPMPFIIKVDVALEKTERKRSSQGILTETNLIGLMLKTLTI
jgi:hypothetical protein